MVFESQTYNSITTQVIYINIDKKNILNISIDKTSFLYISTRIQD